MQLLTPVRPVITGAEKGSVKAVVSLPTRSPWRWSINEAEARAPRMRTKRDLVAKHNYALQ
jgi:hypothetical protein